MFMTRFYGYKQNEHLDAHHCDHDFEGNEFTTRFTDYDKWLSDEYKASEPVKDNISTMNEEINVKTLKPLLILHGSGLTLLKDFKSGYVISEHVILKFCYT